MLDLAKVKALREKSGLSMSECAKRAGFLNAKNEPQRQRWNDIESGRRSDVSADTLYRVAKALGVTMESLMTAETPSA